MNYRHLFHAGNAADVLKHIVLARIIEHLKGKATPFRVIDLHAGAGIYDLRSEQAENTGEWRDGVGRLYRDGSCEPDVLAAPAEALLLPWRKAVAACNDGAVLARYPGSPEIARRLTRDADRLVFNELHPEDGRMLGERFGAEKRAKIVSMDAWAAMRAFLPPPERRGLVFADPPYEARDERQLALLGMAEAHRRFASGVFCLWFPVKAQAEADAFALQVARLNWPKTLRAELRVRRADSAGRLNGSGLIVSNPPWKLADDLAALLPALSDRLADRQARFAGGWDLNWLVGENT